MLCSAKDEEMDSERLRDGNETDSWTGCFSCGELCNRPFDCGVHFCQKSCIPKMHNPRIVPSRPMWCLTAPVVRRH